MEKVERKEYVKEYKIQIKQGYLIKLKIKLTSQYQVQ